MADVGQQLRALALHRATTANSVPRIPQHPFCTESTVCALGLS
jgi:hypothetical protein